MASQRLFHLLTLFFYFFFFIGLLGFSSCSLGFTDEFCAMNFTRQFAAYLILSSYKSHLKVGVKSNTQDTVLCIKSFNSKPFFVFKSHQLIYQMTRYLRLLHVTLFIAVNCFCSRSTGHNCINMNGVIGLQKQKYIILH